MAPTIALILAAATAQASTVPPPPASAVQVSVRATVEIVRAETSSPDSGKSGARRQVRRRGGGQVAVEFE